MNKHKPYFEKSRVTGKEYDLWSVIKILNPKQAAFYCSRGLELQDIEVSEDRKTKEPVFVYYFNKEDTKEVFDIWCKRKQERYGSDSELLEEINNEDNGN